ncbi:MAG: MucR family transcriptional regulator, partial [Pseudomonadota bacterium]
MLYNTTRLTGSPQAEDRLTLTASLVSAYVCNHTVDRPDFINLISDVYNALESLQLEADENAVQSPAVPIDE